MANKKNINTEYVNQVKISKDPTKDLSLGVPETSLEAYYLGDLDDSKEKAAWLNKPAAEREDHQFWWCDQPFVGFAIMAKPIDGGDDDWQSYPVVGPAFVKAAPELASGEFRKAEANKALKDKKPFRVKHEVKTLPTIDPRTNELKRKHVWVAVK